MDITSYLLGKNAGGSEAKLQTKTVTINKNGTLIVTPDSGYDGIESIQINTNVTPQPIDENTLLLLHFDNGYKDDSSYNRSVSGTEPSISYYLNGKFGNCFDLTDSTKGLLYFDDIKSFFIDTFTIDFWIYPKSFSASSSGHGRPIMGDYLRNQWWVYWSIHIGQYQTNAKKWGIKYEQDDGENGFVLYSNTELEANTWQHLAITYDKATKKVCLFTNGIKDGETTIPAEMIPPTVGGDAPYTFTIGNWMNNRYQYPPLSYIDELRISNVIRYTENFTPPDEPY